MAGLHPQLRALIEVQADPGADPPSLAAERAAYLQVALERGGVPEPVAEIEDVLVPRGEARIPARRYRPLHPDRPLGAILWLHGGGWYVGDLDGFDRVCRSLARASGCSVLSLDYRLAPEHVWPAAVEDAGAALRWLRGDGAGRLGTTPDRVLVGGDSAGGNLAAVAARHARDEGAGGGPAPRGQLLVYPALDAALATPAAQEHAEAPVLTADEMRACWDRYLDGADPGHPDASPLRAADLAGVAPAAIAVAGHDPLRDDGLAYARALRAAGVAVETVVFDDMVHGFLRWGGVVDRAQELQDWLGAQARRMLGA